MGHASVTWATFSVWSFDHHQQQQQHSTNTSALYAVACVGTIKFIVIWIKNQKKKKEKRRRSTTTHKSDPSNLPDMIFSTLYILTCLAFKWISIGCDFFFNAPASSLCFIQSIYSLTYNSRIYTPASGKRLYLCYFTQAIKCWWRCTLYLLNKTV